MIDTKLYDSFAKLMEYPDNTFHQRVKHFLNLFKEYSSETIELFNAFATLVEKKSLYEIEEIYTRNFDFNPDCSLEVGWQLYGENYERGNFLVKMRGYLREFNLQESSELPDHITHVLAAFGRMSEKDTENFAYNYLIPAVKKILSSISGENNPYKMILRLICNVVEEDIGLGVC